MNISSHVFLPNHFDYSGTYLRHWYPKSISGLKFYFLYPANFTIVDFANVAHSQIHNSFILNFIPHRVSSTPNVLKFSVFFI